MDVVSSAKWRKSSRSGQGNACVEVADNVPGIALIRDSKLGDASPVLDTSRGAFARFIGAMKAGRFDG